MTFDEYLVKKRINKDAFVADDPSRYREWESMYAQMHPNSFYVAVKMVLNNVRLRYHLREEDIPKPTTTAAPRPAARRAAAPVAAVPARTPEAIPASADAPQEKANEAAGIPATAAAKPRPVVKRPTIRQQTPATEEAPKPEMPTEGAPEPAAPRFRPVIKRPVIARPATTPPADQATEPAVQEPASGTAPEEAKSVRPRPVIKRPAVLQKPNPEGDKPEEATVAKDGTPEAPLPATEKPARPRPVIKRPAALQKTESASETTASKPGQTNQNATDEEQGTGIAAAPQAEESAKTKRPRPVIKRPAALSKPPVPAETAQTPEAADDAPATAILGKTENTIAADESVVGQQPSRPPYPRPIIKRPGSAVTPAKEQAGTDASGSAPALPETAEPESSEEVNPVRQAPPADMAPEQGRAEGQPEKPKPPRPRPIMRRPPPKPEQ